MLKRFSVVVFLILSTACAPHTQYAWQDATGLAREDATPDLETCRNFTARQYRAGVPAGEAYLKNPEEETVFRDNGATGEWRPDRSPDKKVNINAMPRHDIQVDYTGYPGELDYYPDYLDDILEKCMRDRGWKYSAIPNN